MIPRVVLCYTLLCSAVVLGCLREPSPYHSRFAKLPGDNGFKIKISGDPEKYIPGEVYTVFLIGSRSYNNVQHFSRFILTAESSDDSRNVSPKQVGSFQLYRDSLSKFNEDCVNTVSEVNDLQKTEVYVMWTAPPTGSRCITFKAMVLQDSRHWFAEEGQLTRTICEQTSKDIKYDENDCCACDEAKYNLIFEGLWTDKTHPKDFPTSLWLTHFSDVIGASHVRNFSFWGEGHIATDGFRSLAEWGSPRLLESELKVQSKFLKNIVKAPGLWYPNVNSNTSTTFRVDRKRHLISLASMLGPSPDWVVGVNGLNLCLKNCTWIERLDVDLYPYDSGTDSGISYMSPNSETVPKERMYRITTKYPEDPRAPFYDSAKEDMLPLARFYITRDKVVPKSCDEEFLTTQIDLVVSEDSDDTSKPECAVTEYSNWSGCSVTCGKGLRMRTRTYKLPLKAQMFNCQRQLIFKEMCVASVPECEGQPDIQSSSEILEDNEEICKTHPWGEWSECSNTCGVGFTMRTRTFLDRTARKKCTHVILVEKEKCMGPPCPEGQGPDSMCPVTDWSDWSPCSASCGKGIKIRTRFLLVNPELQMKCAARVETVQQRPCQDTPECTLTPEVAKSVCMLPNESGPCQSYFPRWYYDVKSGTCISFVFGGCKGNRNNFLTIDECQTTCSVISQAATGAKSPVLQGRRGQGSNKQNSLQTGVDVDCIVSSWSEWSSCSVTCGVGFSERIRMVKVEAKNGGRSCPRLAKLKRCIRPPCQ